MASTQVVIIPIPKPNDEINAAVEKITAELKAKGITVKYDQDKKKRPGYKFAEYEMHGIPVRLGIGKRDLEKGVVEVARRDTKEKSSQPLEGIAEHIEQLLEDIQNNLFQRALDFRKEHTSHVDTFEEFKEILENKGGFIYCLLYTSPSPRD